MPQRIATGVPGLDVLLGGGLVEGGLYMLEGVPGAGKTILAMQMATHVARAGHQVLVVTLIAESHAKLLRHVSGLGFYDPALIGSRIIIHSAFQQLLDGGLEGLLRLLAASAREHGCDILVLDGFAAAREFSDSRRALAQFLHRLSTLAGSLGLTVLVIAPLVGNESYPEHTLVDGLIELQRIERGLRSAREIEIHKLRGSAHLTGQHVFEITSEGIRVYPRTETLPLPPPRELARERLSTGVPSLDRLIGGGLMRGTATSLMGAPGVGKTLLGLSFLAAGAREGRKGLYFGFFEPPERLLAKGRELGIELEAAVSRGEVMIEWHPAFEMHLDERAQVLLGRVQAEGIEQVFLDGTEGFTQASLDPERVPRYLTALTAQLSRLGVTTVLTEELPLLAHAVESRAVSQSALVENVLLLRFYEHAGELRRLITVVKLRDGNFDSSIREFSIATGGIVVGEQIVGVEQVLQGAPHTIHPERLQRRAEQIDPDAPT